MNLLCRRTWGLACLAIVTVIALVGCGQATSTTAAPEPVRIAPVTLEIGETDQISLSNKFSGEKLTYTATTDKPAIATAKVAGATLTVTAVSAGTAEITVTATDSQDRSAKTSFIVTVRPEPEPEPEPENRSRNQSPNRSRNPSRIRLPRNRRRIARSPDHR